MSVSPNRLEIYFSGPSHPMTATKLTHKTINKTTNGMLTDLSCHLVTVDVVMVDVAQRNEVIDCVRSPIFMMPFVMELQDLARIVGR